MSAAKTKKDERNRTRTNVKPEPPWNVVLHNDWENSMPRVLMILKKIIPGMTFKRAIRIVWEANRSGPAVVKRCHEQLAALYKELLQKEGPTISIEPAR
jgi:ATP-dependent Clp protease adapter protein ClpS